MSGLDREWIARRERWSAKGRAKVSHPNYDPVIVPCGSCYAATLCAADIWGCECDRDILLRTKVEMCDQTLPLSAAPIHYIKEGKR